MYIYEELVTSASNLVFDDLAARTEVSGLKKTTRITLPI
jgi:hypothetical protein